MKKITVFILALFCIVALVGCSKKGEILLKEGKILLKEGTVKSVSVSSLPEGRDYSYIGEGAQDIVDYLSGLNLISDFEEDPDRLSGMTWVIALEYEDGSDLTIYLFGDFIRSNNSVWYKITHEESQGFDRLLDELNDYT